jgi:hypothetical protein
MAARPEISVSGALIDLRRLRDIPGNARKELLAGCEYNQHHRYFSPSRSHATGEVPVQFAE